VTPSLLSVNVGMPKDVSWQGRTIHTGVWKYPVTGPQMVRRLNIDGDGQGDLGGHGGEQRAVLVYQAESHRHWRRHFGRDDISITAGTLDTPTNLSIETHIFVADKSDYYTLNDDAPKRQQW